MTKLATDEAAERRLSSCPFGWLIVWEGEDHEGNIRLTNWVRFLHQRYMRDEAVLNGVKCGCSL